MKTSEELFELYLKAHKVLEDAECDTLEATKVSALMLADFVTQHGGHVGLCHDHTRMAAIDAFNDAFDYVQSVIASAGDPT